MEEETRLTLPEHDDNDDDDDDIRYHLYAGYLQLYT